MSQRKSHLPSLTPRTMPATTGDGASASILTANSRHFIPEKIPETTLPSFSSSKLRHCSSVANSANISLKDQPGRRTQKISRTLTILPSDKNVVNGMTSSAPSLINPSYSRSSYLEESPDHNVPTKEEASPATSESEHESEGSEDLIHSSNSANLSPCEDEQVAKAEPEPRRLKKSPSTPVPVPADRKSLNGQRASSPCLSRDGAKRGVKRSKMHTKQRCKAAKDGDQPTTDKRYTKFFRELRENLDKPSSSESAASLQKDGSDGEDEGAADGELSMFDMLEFVCRTLRLVKSWINEVPQCCRQRLCRCDAFISFFCAEFYKQTEVLVSEELFAFVFWHVLEQNGSPREYDLEFLRSIFEKAKTEAWAEAWKKCPLSGVFDHLSNFLKCQNEQSNENAARNPGSVKVSKVPSFVAVSTHPTEHKTVQPHSPGLHLRESPSYTSLPECKAGKAHVDHVHAQSKLTSTTRQKRFDFPKAESGTNRTMSLESLSGALSNTRLPKSPSKISTLHSVDIPRASPSENTIWRENVEELNSSLAIVPSKYPRPHQSKSAVARNAVDQEVDLKCRERLASACGVLYKTGRRNLLRMLDFALTEFFMQSPNLSCCLLTTKGPILVHDTLFATKCTNWQTIRKTGQKWASRYNVVDLRKEQIPMIGLWTVIEYVYNGSFTVTAGNVFESQKAAEFFGIPLIADISLRLLNCLTSPKMVCHTIESLRQQQKQNHPLWTLALGKLVVCFDECRNDKIMVKWPLDLIVPILEQEELCTKDEVNVYNFAVRWVEADFSRRKTLIPQIMNTVRFVSMPADTLLFISSTAKILDGHSDLRQEIADLHLKVRMETSGFEIPPEMDWSIPRRKRRSPTAAKAYAHSGRDLQFLMLYFCPRAARPNDGSGISDDSVVLLKRYLKLCTKFVFIDEEGQLSRNWLYIGSPKPELREMIRLRQKDLKKRQVWNQSAADLNGQSASIGTDPDEPGDENCDQASTKTRRSTDSNGRRDPRCMDATPGTAFENILKYLSVIEPELPSGGKKESVFDATFSGKRLVDNLVLENGPGRATPEIIVRRDTTVTTTTTTTTSTKTPEKDVSKKVSEKKSTKSLPAITPPAAATSPKAEVPEVRVPDHRTEETRRERPQGQQSRRPVLEDNYLPVQDVNCSSSFFTDWIVDEENGQHESTGDNAQPKKWYMDLAEKMNLLNPLKGSRPHSGDNVRVYPASSSVSVRSRDMNSSASSKNVSPCRHDCAAGDVVKMEAVQIKATTVKREPHGSSLRTCCFKKQFGDEEFVV